MAIFYDIGKTLDIAADSNGNYPSDSYAATSPSWVLAVVRMNQLVTWDRVNSSSLSTDIAHAASEIGKTLIIVSNCMQVAVSDNKGSHVTNLSATLIQGETNYLTEIMPGDWIFCWMVNSEEKAANIAKRIGTESACNNYDDGLKFVGQVEDIRKQVSLDTSGSLTVRYNLMAHGFNEFDSAVYFIPGLSNDLSALPWLTKMFGSLDQIMGISPGSSDTQGIQSQNIIEAWIGILLGTGIPKEISLPVEDSGSQPSYGAGSGGGYAYALPNKVGKLLGIIDSSRPSGVIGAADILETTIGVQSYDSLGFNSTPQAVFTPDLDNDTAASKRRRTKTPLLGIYFLERPSLDGANTVWNTLYQYLNPTINEMYNCLRVNPSGKIMPSLIARQLPFSSPYYDPSTSDTSASRANDILNDALTPSAVSTPKPAVTPFLSLPRWLIPPGMVRDFDVGRSNCSRTNFVWMLPQTPANISDSVKFINCPPLHDDLDISRMGLRMERLSVLCNPNDGYQGAPMWEKIRADITMGQHLTLTGQLVLKGVQDPICIGDNIDFGDGAIYHIEGVSHTCSISGGIKTFNTVINLTHGVNKDGNDAVANSDPTLIYAGTGPDTSLRNYDPEVTYSAQDVNTTPLSRNSKP